MNRPFLRCDFPFLQFVGVGLLALLSAGILTNPAQAQQNYAFQRAIPSDAGDARYDTPADVAFSAADSTVYVADEDAGAVFRYDLEGGSRSPLRSVYADGKSHSLEAPVGLDVGPDGALFIADEKAQRVFVVREDSTASFAMGTGSGWLGSRFGQFNKIRDVTVDTDGYAYVLDEDQSYVPFFDEQGRFLSWIRGGAQNFEELRAVGMNQANELYTLEAEGPSVTIFNAQGQVVSALGTLNQRPGVSIEEPVDLAVLPGGDFLVLDREDGRITHFTREGGVIGTFGARGTGGPGMFKDPIRLSVGHGTPDQVAVLDGEGKQVQFFRVPTRPDTLTASPRKLGLEASVSSPRPFVDLVRQPDGRLYYIPQDNPSTVLGVDSAGSDLQIRVNEAKALASGPDRSLYVLDVGANTIRQYDAEGALIREFGKGLSRSLDDPSDIATLPSGHVLVAERGRGTIRVWTADGVYKSKLALSTGFQEPVALAANDSSRIYVWDEAQNRIVRTRLGAGRPSGQPALRLRTTDVQNNDGEIVGLEIDPLDQVHVFNASTNQYAIFGWAENPVPRFRFGRKGEGPFSFKNVEGIAFDDQRFIAHVLNDGGDAVKSIQLSVRPPSPSDSPHFRNEGDTLIARVPSLENPAVVQYGLLHTNAESGPTTVVTQPTPEFRLPPPAADSLPDVARYAFVSLSPTSASSPTSAFANYFGVGGHFFAQGRHEAALQAYRRAADSLALSDATRHFIAQRYITLGRSLAETYDLDDAQRYLEAGRSFVSADTVGARALGFLYSQKLRKLANEGRYDSLHTVANDVATRSSTTRQARAPVLATVDSIATQLQNRPSETARSNAVTLYKGLRAWTDTSARAAYQYASAQWDFYEIKQRTGAPSFEQSLVLKKALKAAQTAASRPSAGSSLYHKAHLLLLDALIAREKNEKAVQTATKELENKTSLPSGAQRAAYREALATAYRNQEKYDRAISEYRTLVSDHPDTSKYKLALADVLVANESFAKAKTLYQELRQKNPEDAVLVARIGELELKRNNFSEASLQLENALEMNPDLTDVRGLLGKAYAGASNYSNAIEAYRAAVKETRRRLDTTRTDNGATQQIETGAEQLSSHLQNLARLHMKIGQYGEAATVYADLTEVASSDAAAWHGLGQAYMRTGRVYEALDALNRALTLKETSEAISADLSRARSLRDEISQNRSPIELVDTNVDELYPSLYKNYSDPAKLPIGNVVLANNTSVPKPNATLTFYIEDLMDEPTEQVMKSLPSYSNTTILLRAVFNESILQVAEKKTVQARLRLTYQHEGRSEIVEKTIDLTLHSRNSIKWKDKRRLAAFIAPRDPQLIKYTKAIDRLFRNQPTYDLPTNVVTALQTFTVLTKQDYTYSVDPQTDFSVVSRNPEMLDYCQYPEQTIEQKAGDCDDFVTLYLAMLANAGVSTAYVDIPGHVMSAFDAGLSPSELKGSALSREDVIVSQDQVWIPVETTLLGRESFLTAWRKGIERYRKEQKEGDLPQIISMSKARSVYEPSSLNPDSFEPVLPDTSRTLAAYKKQASTLYARQTEAQRKRLRAQLQAHPQNTVVRNRLGILYARSGKNEKARAVYEKGLELTPTNTLLLNNYANVLYQQERYEKAIDLYKQSLDGGVEDPEVYMNLCKAQLALDRTEAAEASFETAIQQDSSLEDAYSYLREQL